MAHLLETVVTKVVNIYKETYEVYIGRRNRFVDPNYGTGSGPSAEPGLDGYYGNPFTLKPKASELERAECLAQYREYFYQRIDEDHEFKLRIFDLKGKTLGCFCKPKACHGDVIVEFLERK